MIIRLNLLRKVYRIFSPRTRQLQSLLAERFQLKLHRHTKDLAVYHLTQRKKSNLLKTAALKAGGIDNGGPGLRKQYAPGYYAAFVLDPDGNNIEAVYRGA